jgi:hypothetical protein
MTIPVSGQCSRVLVAEPVIGHRLMLVDRHMIGMRTNVADMQGIIPCGVPPDISRNPNPEFALGVPEPALSKLSKGK